MTFIPVRRVTAPLLAFLLWPAFAGAQAGTYEIAPTLHNLAATSVISDPVRNRLIVFGGANQFVPASNQVWQWSYATELWTKVATAGTPPALYYHSSIYDPVRDRMVVFGGRSPGSGYDNGVWELSLSGLPTWLPISPAGALPAGRIVHSAVYDPVHDRMIVYGGLTASGASKEVWTLSLSGAPSWMKLVTAGMPPPGGVDLAIHDPVRDRLIVSSEGIVRELPFTTNVWAPIPTSGPVPEAQFAQGAYDPVRDQLVIFGGQFPPGHPEILSDESWTLDLASPTQWQQLAPSGTGPSARYLHAVTYDAAHNALMVFGGDEGSGDLWRLSLATPSWSLLDEGEPTPAPGSRGLMVHDRANDQFILLLDDEVWALPRSSLAWNRLHPSGTPPTSWTNRAAVYDPVGRRVIVFGGRSSGTALDQNWALKLEGSPTWVQLFPSGAQPGARYDHSAIYDPLRDRMIVFGGTNGVPLNDVWALELTPPLQWLQIYPTGALPPGMYEHAAIYDEGRDRMMVAGFDVWALPLDGAPAWSKIEPANPVHGGGSAIYDPVRERMVVDRHSTDFSPRIHALSLTGTPQWTPLPGASFTDGGATVYDPKDDRMIEYGPASCTQQGNCFYNHNTYFLTWGTPLLDAPPSSNIASASAILGVRPNPGVGEQAIELRIATNDEARRIEVFTVGGRRVWSRALPASLVGDRTWTWDGRTARGPAGPGVYFARLVTARGATTRRFVRVE